MDSALEPSRRVNLGECLHLGFHHRGRSLCAKNLVEQLAPSRCSLSRAETSRTQGNRDPKRKAWRHHRLGSRVSLAQKITLVPVCHSPARHSGLSWARRQPPSQCLPNCPLHRLLAPAALGIKARISILFLRPNPTQPWLALQDCVSTLFLFTCGPRSPHQTPSNSLSSCFSNSYSPLRGLSLMPSPQKSSLFTMQYTFPYVNYPV